MNVYARSKLAAELAQRGDLRTAQKIVDEIRLRAPTFPGIALDGSQTRALDDASTSLAQRDGTSDAKLAAVVDAFAPKVAQPADGLNG